MKIIKEFKHVLLYDKNDKHFNCTNKPDEIESLLQDAPVVIKSNDQDELVGVVLYASHRSKTSLYYGDIILKNEYNDWTNIKIIDTRGIPIREGSHKMKSIIIYIEKVD